MITNQANPKVHRNFLIYCIYLDLVCSLKAILNTVLFTKLAWPSRQRKSFCEFSSIQAIVQLWLPLKQQANKQWVKTLSTHSKLACWWVNLYSEKKKHHVSLRQKKQAKAAQPKGPLD